MFDAPKQTIKRRIFGSATRQIDVYDGPQETGWLTCFNLDGDQLVP